MNARPSVRAACRLRQRGLSMIELLVALAIGAFLVFGATQVYVDSRGAYNVNETVARLQETARYALSVIEPDVRMANYFGLVKGASIVSGQTSQSQAANPNWAANTVCGNNFVVDLNRNLQSDDNRYLTDWTGPATAVRVPTSCDSLAEPDGVTVWNTTPVTTADTLVVRRASVVNSVSTANWLQICSTRLAGQLATTGPACAAASQQVNNLVVNAYYVDQNSSQATGLPSLRRKTLIHPAGGTDRLADEEIIPGIEDMQIQFGIDNTGISAIATRYVNPSQLQAALAAGGQVVAVRVWLLVRSDAPEVGFTDNRVYEYGDRLQANGTTGDLNAAAGAGKAYSPSASTDTGPTGRQHYRRLLVSSTIQIRNALGT